MQLLRFSSSRQRASCQPVTDGCLDKSAADGLQRVFLFPPLFMGQYFKAVNLDRHEYVCPWCLGGGAKFWEWAANPQGAIFTLLLRKSNDTGGGDIPRHHFVADPVDGDGDHGITKSLVASLDRDEPDAELPADSVIGTWVGDRIALVGDYDSSGLYTKSKAFTNISEQLAREWNRFIDVPGRTLTYHDDCSCRTA